MTELHVNSDLIVPVLVTKRLKHCDIFIPDLDITIHGSDYVDAISNAILKASAIYYYNLDRNLKFEFSHSYADVERMCKSRGQFATFINLTT